jgi:hypothetical protein
MLFIYHDHQGFSWQSRALSRHCGKTPDKMLLIYHDHQGVFVAISRAEPSLRENPG